MRPVFRGFVPIDPETQNPILYSHYQDARKHLIERLGEYCSYCEMHLDASLAVEHVKPKSLNPSGERNWNNFLLACSNCNSTKGNQPIRLNNFFWPDRDNTFRAFVYGPGALVKVSDKLTELQRKRAENLMHLVGFHKNPTNDPTASDRRWINRHNAWDKAQRAKHRLAQISSHDANSKSLFRKQIVDTARAGYWSVWMSVFADDLEIRQQLIDDSKDYRGTCQDCFDDKTQPKRRPKGLL